MVQVEGDCTVNISSTQAIIYRILPDNIPNRKTSFHSNMSENFIRVEHGYCVSKVHSFIPCNKDDVSKISNRVSFSSLITSLLHKSRSKVEPILCDLHICLAPSVLITAAISSSDQFPSIHPSPLNVGMDSPGRRLEYIRTPARSVWKVHPC